MILFVRQDCRECDRIAERVDLDAVHDLVVMIDDPGDSIVQQEIDERKIDRIPALALTGAVLYDPILIAKFIETRQSLDRWIDSHEASS